MLKKNQHYCSLFAVKTTIRVSLSKRSQVAIFFQMSFRPTCCPREKRRIKHEINRYVYPDLHDSSLVVPFSNISAYLA